MHHTSLITFKDSMQRLTSMLVNGSQYCCILVMELRRISKVLFEAQNSDGVFFNA